MKLITKIKGNKRMSLLVLLVILFVISGGAILYMRHTREVTATTDSLVATKASTPKTSTKLSFTDAKKLPKTYTAGEDFPLSFVIENHEGKEVDYPYTVTANGVQVAAHTIHVKDRTDQTIKELFTLPSDQQALVIEVKLTNQNRSIHFSMERSK